MNGSGSIAVVEPASPTRQGRPWAVVLHQIATDRIARVIFIVVFVVVGFGDSILLPFDFTQRVSFANWHYLDTRYVAFSVAFALGMSWVSPCRSTPCGASWRTGRAQAPHAAAAPSARWRRW
jgi:hypothetical protein